ncbi:MULTISPECIES: twin-arginine translocase TatA/TatE family subunit [Calditerrivibrio]|uniref:Sec-independent protein translocase protein TatA n=2 Tax=Calditerrivibrio nitroreducens TaxID=477976 RepID=E4TEH9_CALNY|nr:twin-arginine translocase TatA/TatE family subunit [Calditerrivibrio nitroreducens]ADR18305.1 twin-arginine translocation protein, TatA/E family subunit [Calditerrivibrio nitroreducens DSM 19672]
MFGLGTQEIILILLVVLVIFGAGKLPQIGESMGKAIRNFKSAAKDEDAIDITPKKDGENKDQQKHS